MSRNITVSIDRLILDGLPIEGMNPEILGTHVQAALEALLAEGGLQEGIAAGGSWSSVRGGAINVATGNPEQLGSQIAQAIHTGLGDQRGEGS